MQDTDIYLVRHGQAQCNLGRIITGQTESALTDVGRDEARKLKEKMGRIHFDKVISSDLSRAVETAKVLAGMDAAIQQFPELRKRSFGRLEGQPDSVLKPLLDAHAQLRDLSPARKLLQIQKSLITCATGRGRQPSDRLFQNKGIR